MTSAVTSKNQSQFSYKVAGGLACLSAASAVAHYFSASALNSTDVDQRNTMTYGMEGLTETWTGCIALASGVGAVAYVAGGISGRVAAAASGVWNYLCGRG